MLAAAVVSAAFAVSASAAMGETCPEYVGGYMSTTIHSATDPEDYCWKVTTLNEGQTLEQVNDQQILVRSNKTGATVWQINAQPARDAEGTAVPTSIALTGEREFIYTVPPPRRQSCGGWRSIRLSDLRGREL